MRERLRSFFVGLLLLITVSTSQAYDQDTHFYETYMLARYAGIGHEVAAQLAVFSQWIDESGFTSATFPTLIIGGRMRRLFHFPAPLISYSDTDANVITHGLKLKIAGMVEKDNLFSRELLREGLQKRNLLMIGAGIHTRQDSFGHSGTPWTIGHTSLWHHPDRPFWDVEKHDEMTTSLFVDMVNIRDYLPEAALDKSFVDVAGDTPHYLLSAEELQKRYIKNPQLRRTIENDIFGDPRYTRKAIAFIFQIAQKNGLFTHAEKIAKLVTDDTLYVHGRDVRTILKTIVMKLFAIPAEQRSSVFNMERMYEALLFDIPREHREGIGTERIINTVVHRMTEGTIPMRLDKENHILLERDGDLRNWEMRFRLDDWRQTIFQLTGRKIRYSNEKIKTRINRWLKKTSIRDDGLDDHELITPTVWERFVWMYRLASYGSFFNNVRAQGSADNFLMTDPLNFADLVGKWANALGITVDEFELVTETKLADLQKHYEAAAKQAARNAQVQAAFDGEDVADLAEVESPVIKASVPRENPADLAVRERNVACTAFFLYYDALHQLGSD